MRDGVKLFTSVYVPKDLSQKYPIMLDRTPYSVAPYGIDSFRGQLGPSEKFAKDGFIFAYQDVRGKHMSEGEFADMRPHNPNKRGPRDIDESSNTCDLVDWLVKNVPDNNGRVGIWGISYPGFYTAAGIIGWRTPHPAIKAASPQAPITDRPRRRRCPQPCLPAAVERSDNVVEALALANQVLASKPRRSQAARPAQPLVFQGL